MLLEDIVSFCDKKYTTFGDKCGCGTCNHPSGNCSGSCYNCLYEIHYPSRAKSDTPKKVYDCPKMLYHYVCQYSYLYATELLCAFEEETDYLKDYPYYHIMSLGCGGCADLIAFERFYAEMKLSTPISYIGIDVNDLWHPVNSRIAKYCGNTDIKYKVRYHDAFKFFRQQSIPDANILVISYLISYLYNTKQINTIDDFIDDVVKNIVQRKKKEQKFLIVVNDVNSNRRGRGYFDYFIKKLNAYKLSIVKSKYKYFDTGNLYPPQKIGSPYSTTRTRFPIPSDIAKRYHAQEYCQQTVQLILEVI